MSDSLISSTTISSNVGRKPDGRFAPGNRANPHGRPAGSRNKATLALEMLMADDAAEVVAATIAAAKAGDIAAARLVLDRVLPPRKGRPVQLDLPPVATASDLLAALSATLDAMAAGEIRPEEAAVVAGVLEAKRKAIETVDIEARLARLEQQQQPARGR